MSNFITRIGNKLTGKEQSSSNVPLINEKANLFSFDMSNSSGLAQTSNSPVTYDELWEIWSQTPECIAPCDTIITDIIADGYTIEPIEADDEESVKKAEQFLEGTQFKYRVLPSHLLDELVTGDAYIYKNFKKPDEEMLKKVAKNTAKKVPFNNKKYMEQYLYYKLRDDDNISSMNLINLASSTIKLRHNVHGDVEEYLQSVGTKKESFSPQEVMHFRYMNMNGKMYSFTPMKSIIPEAILISLIKDLATKTFDSGGVPSYLFTLPEDTPMSENTKFLQQQLKEFKNKTTSSNALVLTGKVEPKAIENNSAEMQYQQLLDQTTRIIYTAWGVPPSKMGQSGQGDGAYDSGLATEGYYRRIAHLQDKTYSQYNAQLLIPEFGVKLVPKKMYMQDELKESQMLKQKMDIAQQAFNNNWWNEDMVVKFLGIEDQYKGTFEKQEMSSPFLQGDMSKDKLKDTPKQEMDKMRSEKQKGTKPKKEEKEKEKTKSLLTPREREAIAFNEKL